MKRLNIWWYALTSMMDHHQKIHEGIFKLVKLVADKSIPVEINSYVNGDIAYFIGPWVFVYRFQFESYFVFGTHYYNTVGQPHDGAKKKVVNNATADFLHKVCCKYHKQDDIDKVVYSIIKNSD